MAALEILQNLQGIDFQSIPSLQRILLITDGTLTEILEAHFLEKIQLVKLSQNILAATAAHNELTPHAEEKVLERKILLKGTNSGTVYVYAESIIAFERLDAPLRDGLLQSDVPLGRLWLEHKLETFKELISIRAQPAGDLSRHFGCEASAPLLMRSYRVSAGDRPVMLISEYFHGK